MSVYSYPIWEEINKFLGRKNLHQSYHFYLLTGNIATGIYLIERNFFQNRITLIAYTLGKLIQQGHFLTASHLYHYYSYHKILIDQTITKMLGSYHIINQLRKL